MQLTSDALSAGAGIVLSLILSYAPGVSVGYAKLDGTRKRLIVLGLVVLIALAAFGLGCAGVTVFGVMVACTQAGAVGLFESVVWVAIASQVTDRMSPAIGPAADITRAQAQAATVAAVAVAAGALAPGGDSGVPTAPKLPG